GAFSLGLIIGWFVYYINRYRKGDVQLSDITTLVGVIGGGGSTALFNQSGFGPSMFGAYGIGLAVGFFAYFYVLIVLVSKSDNFTADWLLDGRRKDPMAPFAIPSDAAQTERAFDADAGPSPQELAIQTAASA